MTNSLLVSYQDFRKIMKYLLSLNKYLFLKSFYVKILIILKKLLCLLLFLQ